MLKKRQILIDLVQAAIWDRPADTSQWQKPVDWNGVYELAKTQALRGLAIDAILNLPVEWLPEKPWYVARLNRLMEMAQDHALHQAVSNELLDRFEANGVHALLMKGVTMGALYPNPQYRACGDIDLYIGPEKYDQAINLLCEWAGSHQTDVVKDDKHTSLFYKSIEIELHRITEYFSVPNYNRRWQEWTRACLDNCKEREFPLNYNVVFLFNHIWHHFCIYGIGLRQFCDWTLYLHHHAAEIDREALKKDLERIGLFRQWQMFGCVAVDTLGLPEEEFPYYDGRYRNKATRIVNQVFEDGNFGKSGRWLAGKPRNYLKRKLHSAYFWCKRLAMVWQFSPVYATFTVLDYMKYGVEVVFKDVFKNNN